MMNLGGQLKADSSVIVDLHEDLLSLVDSTELGHVFRNSDDEAFAEFSDGHGEASPEPAGYQHSLGIFRMKNRLPALDAFPAANGGAFNHQPLLLHQRAVSCAPVLRLP